MALEMAPGLYALSLLYVSTTTLLNVQYVQYVVCLKPKQGFIFRNGLSEEVYL